MAHLTPAAHARLAAQHGVITTAQLAAAGMHPRAIDRLLATGVLTSAVSGAYRSPSVRWTEEARCVALCLARPDVVIAGPTAGRHWGFRKLPKDRRVHVIAPPHAHPCGLDWVHVYRTAAMHDIDVVELADGRRVTSRPRTVLDLSRSESEVVVRSLIEQARRDGRHAIDDFIAVAADWQSPRRPWLRSFLELVADCLPGGAAESHEETLVGIALVGAGVRGLHRQFRLALRGRPDARFDLAVPALRWAIEVDIFPTHREIDGVAADRARDEATGRLGWITTRIGPESFGPAFGRSIERVVDVYRTLRQTNPLQ